MAKCRCSGESICACTMQVGPGLVVTGTGTPADPWIISVEPATAPGGIETGPGLSGNGTTVAPLQLDLCTYAELKNACVP